MYPYTKSLLQALFSLKCKGEIQLLEGGVPNPLDLPEYCLFKDEYVEFKKICWKEKPVLKLLSNEWGFL